MPAQNVVEYIINIKTKAAEKGLDDLTSELDDLDLINKLSEDPSEKGFTCSLIKNQIDPILANENEDKLNNTVTGEMIVKE